MDYNDIAARLKRTLTSMNARFDDEVAVYANVTETTEKINETESLYTFKVEYKMGKQDMETLVNKISIILYNISSLKDHLKKKLVEVGGNPNLVEDEINNSLHLQVVMDIVNQEKHGYPLTKTKRSNLDPKIKNISESYMITATATSNNQKAQARVFFTPDGIKHVGDGKESMVIVADITDGQDNKIFTLDELVETAFSKMKKIVEENLDLPN